LTDALSIHYAQALADAVFASNSGVSPQEAVDQLATSVRVLTSTPDLQRVLLSPSVPRAKKIELIGRILEGAGVSRLLRNFVKVVVEHRRVAELDRIQSGFELVVDERQGLVRAEIISAAELSDSQKDEVLRALGSKAGKYIRPVYKVDESILGGVIARVGSKEYDGSLTGRLEAMRRRLVPVSNK
jgi:F-type H+-transporting ATPase subunit delta